MCICVGMNVSLSFTWVGIETLANARGLRFVRILLIYIHVINVSSGNGKGCLPGCDALVLLLKF
jgi:hypothetical protein